MTVLDTLLEADDALSDWVIRAHPRTEEEARQMREVLALRTKLNQSINALVARQLDRATQSVAAEIQAVTQATAKLRAMGKTLDRVQDVLAVAGTLADIAGRLVAMSA